MSPDDIRLIIGLVAGLGGAYQFITKPLKADMQALESKLQKEIMNLKLELSKELNQVEKRLNERIDAWIIRK